MLRAENCDPYMLWFSLESDKLFSGCFGEVAWMYSILVKTFVLKKCGGEKKQTTSTIWFKNAIKDITYEVVIILDLKYYQYVSNDVVA